MKPKTTITIKVPYAKIFDDYHEIEHFADGIPLGKVKLKCYECGFDGYYYIGLFYVGRRPSNQEIKLIVQRDLNYSKEAMKEIEWTWEK